MKRKQIVKLLSISMACVLSISGSYLPGGMVLAEEVPVEKDLIEEEGTTEEFDEVLGFNEINKSYTEQQLVDEIIDEQNNAIEVIAQKNEIEDEEDVKKIEGATFAEKVIQMKSFYGKELDFDEDSTWDDKGEWNLGLTTENALNAGAKVSFDIYIPANSDYNGLLKVQGIARLGDNWTWTQNNVIPEISTSDWDGEVVIEGISYKKVNLSFPFSEEIVTDYLADFTVKLAGYNCDYKGYIYYDNVELLDGKEQMEEKQENELMKWCFDENIDGWNYDGTWDNQGSNSITWDEDYQALTMDVDYSKDSSSSWSEIKTTFGEELKLSGVNKLSLDFIYQPSLMDKGGFKIKIFSNGAIDTFSNVNTENAEDYTEDLRKVKFEIDFSDADLEKGLTIGVIGCETDYQGKLYLDNITLYRQESTQEDIYVDATETITGQEIQLSIQGNNLMTGSGNSEIDNTVTLVDQNALPCAKQIYSYLKAVGNTESVIFGQQNNTSHKAGNESLSCADTMDVVESYAGVIGLDGLALTGNEYSADRYLEEMKELDERYEQVIQQIAQVSTVEEKNVIAAAALTNYNIRNGAIATLSLHMPNFSLLTKKDADVTYAQYDFSGYSPNVLTGDVMNQILPGGSYNEAYRAYLDMVAEYAHEVEGAVLFRPFHENTGSWFWWGAAFCDEQTYKSVFKYTVEYLRDEKLVHNFIYVYGPGSEAANMEEYAARYPGDGYVDMVGFDMYHSNPEVGDSFISNFEKELGIVDDFAKEHNKLVAVTETGAAHDTVEGDNQTALVKQGNNRPDWYQEILEVVKKSNASYFLVWANFGEKDGFYTPYVKKINEDGTKHGHELMDNFIRFFNQQESIFAINQKDALCRMSDMEIEAIAAMKQDGYIVTPVSGSRILKETDLTARVSGVSEQDEVYFLCQGEERDYSLSASVVNGYATTTLSEEALKALGKKVGQIKLFINGEEVDEIRANFNIEAPQDDPYEIDGSENYYGVDTLLTKSWSTNKATGSMVTLSLSKDYNFQDEYVMKFSYKETQDGWAGATISKEVDWSDCNALRFYTVPDGKQQKTVIQITANGNTYEYYMNQNADYCQAGTRPVLVTIPFEKFVARDIAGNPAGGLENDKGMVSSIGLWVNAIAGSDAIDGDGMVSGIIYYDSITAIQSDAREVVVDFVTDDNLDNGEENFNKDNDSIDIVEDETQMKETEIVMNEETNNRKHSSKRKNSSSTVMMEKEQNKKSWYETVRTAYQLAQLNKALVPLGGNLEDATSVVPRLIVDIDMAEMIDKVIPQQTVEEMRMTDADYHLHFGKVVLVITHDQLMKHTGQLDVSIFMQEISDYTADFDAIILREKDSVYGIEKNNFNVDFPEEKRGKILYLFGKDEVGEYILLKTEQIGENRIMISTEGYKEFVMLY